MKCKIPFQIRMPQGIMLVPVGISRIDGLHASVEAEDEIIEVQPQAETVCNSHLLIEVFETELSSRLFRITAQCPDVPGIHEGGTIQFPEQMRAILCIQVQLHVARLVDEVYPAVHATELARPEFPHAPAPDRVGSAGKIAFLEGEDGTVPVREGDTDAAMQCQCVAVIEVENLRVREVELGILGISDVEQRTFPLSVLLEIEQVSQPVQKVSRQFHTCPESMAGTVVMQSEARTQDEQVLVILPQDGIACRGIVEVVALEGAADPRHVDITEVEKFEVVCQVVYGIRPMVFPCRREDPAVKFRTVLEIPAQ